MKVKIEKEKELEKALTLDEEEELLKVQIKKLVMPQLNGNRKLPEQNHSREGASAVCGRRLGDHKGAEQWKIPNQEVESYRKRFIKIIIHSLEKSAPLLVL